MCGCCGCGIIAAGDAEHKFYLDLTKGKIPLDLTMKDTFADLTGVNQKSTEQRNLRIPLKVAA